MPELPEVETIVQQLKPQIQDRKIIKTEILRSSQWKNPENAVFILENSTIKQISRRAKFIIFELENGFRLIIHLRMTGKLIWNENLYARDRYARTIFHLDNGSHLQYIDTRALGRLEIVAPNFEPDCLKKLGIEPLDDDFQIDILRQLLDKSKLEIKDFLIDQKKIAGIGNIYANEILFRSGIHPKRVSSSLTAPETERLFHTIPKVLSTAISRMGTTLGNKVSDYRNVYGKNGDFQTFLQVYGRTGEPCLTCGEPIIRIVQKGRSSFVCENCQK